MKTKKGQSCKTKTVSFLVKVPGLTKRKRVSFPVRICIPKKFKVR